MSDNSFLGAFSYGFYVGGAIFGLLSAFFWMDYKIRHQDEQIEELFSRLEDSEENHELKK